jgi:DNA-binding CsgD family transcriptional regulator
MADLASLRLVAVALHRYGISRIRVVAREGGAGPVAMERLRQSDLRGALDLIGECEAATDVASFGRAVTGVTGLVPGAVAFNEIDLASGVATALIDPPELASAAVLAEFGRLAHQNPLVVHGRRGDPPLAISDFLSERSFRALEIYGAIFEPYGFRDQIAVHLTTSSHRVAGVAINRDGRSFSGRDRELLELLTPHLGRAYAHALERERAAAQRGVLERGLAEAGTAAMLIGPDGELEPTDERGEALLWRFFARPARGGLPAELRDWLRRDGASGRSLVVADGEGRRLSARLLECDGQPRWRAILLDEWGEGPAPGELRALGLTEREAEVLAWAARGKSDAQIGALLSISHRTVDKHLEHLFRKLEVSSRAEAVARALSRKPAGARCSP